MGVCCVTDIRQVRPAHGSLINFSEISKSVRLESNVHLVITNRYEFTKVLGYGNFGTVREAIKLDIKTKTPLQNHKHYAIKSISKAKLHDNLEHLKNELDILKLVDHPNIIKLYETYEDTKFIHLVTELCQGGDLYEYFLDKGSLTENEVSQIIHKGLSAVSHLHASHICHRDIKPENFIMANKNADSEIKLIDFGMSVRFSQDVMETKVGTPYYVAPEILKGNYGKECDI